MPLYEVLLLRDDENETRLTDRALEIGETLPIAGEEWVVQREAAPERADASARFVCVLAEPHG